MNNTSLMNWNTFKETLLANAEHPVQYKIGEGQFVDPSYHITEIKQAPITSVDCGGLMNAWTEVIVQLWEPEVKDAEQAMLAKKALGIIDIVEQKLSLHPSAIVKIEFGNEIYSTRQMYPASFEVKDDQLIIELRGDTVQCKAIERGGSCGTTPSGEECCSPKLKIELVNLADNNVCTPGSGCC